MSQKTNPTQAAAPELDGRSTVTLTGLPDAPSSETPAFSARSRTDAYRLVTGSRVAATAAGDSGAINVWLDDQGSYRAEFMVHGIVRSELVPTYVKARLREWLADLWPAMERD